VLPWHARLARLSAPTTYLLQQSTDLSGGFPKIRLKRNRGIEANRASAGAVTAAHLPDADIGA